MSISFAGDNFVFAVIVDLRCSIFPALIVSVFVVLIILETGLSLSRIYFSTIFENKIKAWHLHKEATLNYACVYGKVKLALFDERKTSETYGKYQELFLSLENYSLITIPPNIWNGFKGLSKEFSIIANCLNLPHNEKEMLRLDVDNERFNYLW